MSMAERASMWIQTIQYSFTYFKAIFVWILLKMSCYFKFIFLWFHLKLWIFLKLLCVRFRPQKIVWHGSDSKGKRMMDSYCEAWGTSKTAMTGMGSSLMEHKLLGMDKFSCNNAFVLLCVENTARTVVRKWRRAVWTVVKKWRRARRSTLRWIKISGYETSRTTSLHIRSFIHLR